MYVVHPSHLHWYCTIITGHVYIQKGISYSSMLHCTLMYVGVLVFLPLVHSSLSLPLSPSPPFFSPLSLNIITYNYPLPTLTMT